MKLLEKYMPAIERSPRRTSLYLGTDVLFLTRRRARMEWGDFRRSRSNIPMVRETVVLAITAQKLCGCVMSLTPTVLSGNYITMLHQELYERQVSENRM